MQQVSLLTPFIQKKLHVVCHIWVPITLCKNVTQWCDLLFASLETVCHMKCNSISRFSWLGPGGWSNNWGSQDGQDYAYFDSGFATDSQGPPMQGDAPAHRSSYPLRAKRHRKIAGPTRDQKIQINFNITGKGHQQWCRCLSLVTSSTCSPMQTTVVRDGVPPQKFRLFRKHGCHLCSSAKDGVGINTIIITELHIHHEISNTQKKKLWYVDSYFLRRNHL